MSGLRRDLRDGWRGLSHQRAFSAAALIMLALGIALSSAIFAAVQAVVVKMPFREPERVVTIHARDAEGEHLPIPMDRFEAWRQASDHFESMAVYTLASPVLTGNDAAVRLEGEAMSAGMFAVLGVQPVLGRAFREDDGAVIVLSHAFWHSHFGADPEVLGRAMVLDGVATTVIGVMPEGFEGPRSRPGDFWIPFVLSRAGIPGRPLTVSVLGRLTRDSELQAARARLQAMPWDSRGDTQWTAVVRTAHDDALYQEALSQVRILGGAVGLVLLMACVNVASLLLGRNVSRRRELALRLALGAGRRDIMRQVAIESLLLSAGAAVISLLLAWWCIAAIGPFIPRSFPRIGQIRVDLGVVGFAALAALVTGLLVSIWPAWTASRQELTTALKAGERGNAGGARRARTALVVVEATLGMIVLTAAALMVGAFVRLHPTSPGFEMADRTKFTVRFDGPRYRDRAARLATVEEIANRLRALPGARGASSVTSLPLTGSSAVFPVSVVGAVASPGRPPTIFFRAALADYLPLLGMPILAGRGLTDADGAAAELVAVVNEEFVVRMLRGRQPLASEIVIQEPDGSVVRRIVGIVRNARLFGNDLRPRPEVFVPYAQSPLSLTSFVVHAQPGQQVEAEIRRVVGAIDGNLPIDRLQTLEAVAERSVSLQRFFAMLMGAFAVTALALAFVGLYAVTAWSVSQRTREISVRVALGAKPADISRMVLRYGATVGVTGALVGSVCTFVSTTLLESYLFGFPARQPALFVLLGISFVAVVTLASYMPARRAMRVDPMAALRAD